MNLNRHMLLIFWTTDTSLALQKKPWNYWNHAPKAKKMNCWETLYMQKHRKLNILISEQLITEFNPLYDLAYTPRDLQPYSYPWTKVYSDSPLLHSRQYTQWVPLCSHHADYMDSLHEFVALSSGYEDGLLKLDLLWSETCRGEVNFI